MPDLGKIALKACYAGVRKRCAKVDGMQFSLYGRRRRKFARVATMRNDDKAQQVNLQARDLRCETEDVLLAALRTALLAVGTMCMLAEDETGEERARHLQKAENGLQAVVKMAQGIRLNRQDRHALEQARRDVLSLREKIDPSSQR